MELTKIFFAAVILITVVPVSGHAEVIPDPTIVVTSGSSAPVIPGPTGNLFVEVSPFDVMPEGPSSKLSAGALRESVEILCDPIFAGRGTGTDGARYASEWIRDMFEDAGLMPFEENWYHEFPLSSGNDSGPGYETSYGVGSSAKKGRNVVGYLPGTSGKWILVGAYYDGLGMIGGKV